MRSRSGRWPGRVGHKLDVDGVRLSDRPVLWDSEPRETGEDDQVEQKREDALRNAGSPRGAPVPPPRIEDADRNDVGGVETDHGRLNTPADPAIRT